MSHNFINILTTLDELLNRTFEEEKSTIKHTKTSFIENLEKIIIIDDNSKLSCAICQDSFKIGDNVIKLPCSDNQTHYYHYDTDSEICEGILPWLKNNNTCPVCRTEFPFDEPEDNNNSEDNNLIENNNSDENNSVQDVDDIMRSIFNRSNYINMISRPRPIHSMAGPVNASNSGSNFNMFIRPMNYSSLNESDFNMIPIPLNSSLSATSNINQMTISPPLIHFRSIPVNHLYSEDEDPELQEAIRRSLED